MGYLDIQSDRPVEALDHFREASEQFDALGRNNPGVTAYQAGLAQSRLQGGDALRDLGRRDEALAEYRAALATFERLSRERPGDAQVSGSMVTIHMAIGDTYLELKREEEGEREFLAAATRFDRVRTPSPSDLYNIAGAYTRLADLAWTRRVGATPEDGARATIYADRAVAFLRRSFTAGRRDLSAFRDRPSLRDRPDFRLLLLDAAFPEDPLGP
jgi:tetratricopeptide (TPR) repeat protein